MDLGMLESGEPRSGADWMTARSRTVLPFGRRATCNSEIKQPPHPNVSMYSVISVLRRLFLFLVFLSIVSTAYLCFYPVFLGCAFPSAKTTDASGAAFRYDAPFRLLALGDPQLEGDTSLPNPHGPLLPSVYTLWNTVRDWSSGNTSQLIGEAADALKTLVGTDLALAAYSVRKRFDLWGNDYYLAHIYRTMSWWADPTHVAVMGDLLGSQWIEDEEFEHRADRYWSRVFRDGSMVEDTYFGEVGQRIEVLGEDPKWKGRVVNVAGNHDIGYAGDMTHERIERFRTHFGKENWDVWFKLPPTTEHTDGEEPPILRLVVLNSLNLDYPAFESDLQGETYDFLNHIIATARPVEDRTSATVLLTHLPLHKEAGICADGPFIDFYPSVNGGGVKEQNHLSEGGGRAILEGLFGMSANRAAPAGGLGRRGIVLDGHDHVGCDVYHHIAEFGMWKARRWDAADPLLHLNRSAAVPGIREVTVRSMMGDYGGNAGLLSAWYDWERGQWEFEYASCSLGKVQIWWAVYIIDLITCIMGVALGIEALLGVSSKDATVSTGSTRSGKGNGKSKHNHVTEIETLNDTFGEGKSSSRESRGSVRRKNRGG